MSFHSFSFRFPNFVSLVLTFVYKYCIRTDDTTFDFHHWAPTPAADPCGTVEGGTGSTTKQEETH